MTSQRDLVLPVVDIFTSVPTAERLALEIRSWGSTSGYSAIFGERWASQLDLSPKLIAEVAALPKDKYLSRAVRILQPHIPSLEGIIALIREAGIVTAVIHAPLPVDVNYANDATAGLVAEAPDLFVGFIRIDPTNGRRAKSEIMRGVRELGLRGITMTPFWHGIRCTDSEVAPVFEAAAELNIPVWIHCSMNWVTERPLELEHPRHIDEVAGRYPTVRIVCGHGGWPWVQDLVAVAWRHENVYIDISAFRPKNIFVPGSGWDAFVYYGARTIREKIVYGTTWTLLGVSPSALTQEARDVPWPDEVKRSWLHDNAHRLLGLGE